MTSLEDETKAWKIFSHFIEIRTALGQFSSSSNLLDFTALSQLDFLFPLDEHLLRNSESVCIIPQSHESQFSCSDESRARSGGNKTFGRSATHF